MTPPSFRVALAAGGTGGHIAPALALAEALERLEPDCRVVCMTGEKPLECEMYEAAGREPVVLPGRALSGRNPIRLAGTACIGARSIARALAVLRRERPDVLVGMGGYVAAPAIVAARMLGIPVWLHEQNAVAGRANRLLARLATVVSAAHASALPELRASRGETIGNPLPLDFLSVDRQDGFDAFGLDPERPVLLVLGGSQGAARLNEIVFEMGRRLCERFPTEIAPQILWACGQAHFERWEAALRDEPALRRIFQLHAFIRDTPAAYACADLAITRAGAGTLTELTAAGLPSILVPYPHARDDHQMANARRLVEGGAALLLPETDLDAKGLAVRVERLLLQPRLLMKMSAMAQHLAEPDAAWRMAEAVLRLSRASREKSHVPESARLAIARSAEPILSAKSPISH